MKMTRTVVTLIIVISMLAAIALIGCNGEPTTSDVTTQGATTTKAGGDATTLAETTAAPEETIDLSKEVHLFGYLLGAAPAGFQDVMDALNVKLLADLNCTMEINHIGWGDMQSKYPLVLAAGTDIDWIFTAPWSFYPQQADRGAFLELTEEIFQKYMPLHWEAIKDTTALAECRINGKTYMIPTATPDKKVPVVMYREDLRVKYNVPEINKFSDLDPYFAAIKANEPGMIPMDLESTFDLDRPLSDLMTEAWDVTDDPLMTTGGGCGLIFRPFDTDGKLYYFTSDPDVLPYYVAAAKTVKSWYDKGYLNRNAFANDVRSKESFVQGKSGIGLGNSLDLQGNIAQAEAAGYTVGLIPILGGESGKSPADSYNVNGAAIAASSPNWERALMALDLIIQDKEYERLVYYGIEGVNYALDGERIGLPAGITDEENTYPADAAGFWFTNKNYHLPLVSWTESYIALDNRIASLLSTNLLAAFAPDTEVIKTEAANLNQVLTQYYNPIKLGAVDDVDAAFALLDEKLKAAGLDKVKTELDAQIAEYLANVK